MVKYIDYDHEWISPDNMFSPFMYKRKSFEHENEARAVIARYPAELNQETISGNGLKVKVDILNLIERIYVAPSSPNWFAELVKEVVAKYGYDFQVMHSRLNDQPLF